MPALSWPLLLVSGLFNTIGWVAFIVGKRREEHLRMLWGGSLFVLSMACAGSWAWLLLSGLGLTALILWKPE